jgi:hypothetical protein
VRNGRRLPATGLYGRMIEVLRQTSDITVLIELLDKTLRQIPGASPDNHRFLLLQHLQVLEVMVQEGWVERKIDNRRHNPGLNPVFESIRSGPEVLDALRRAGRSDLMHSRIDDGASAEPKS